MAQRVNLNVNAQGYRPNNPMPNINFNPQPNANPIDAILSGVERGQSLGLRQKAMQMEEEQLALQKRKQEDQDFESFTNSLLAIHKLPKSVQPEYWKGIVAPKASKVGFELDPDSFEEEDRSTLDEAVQLIEAHKKDPKLVTRDDVRGGFQILAMKATKAGDDTGATRFMDVAKQYEAENTAKPFYFVDPTTREMFDANLQPLTEAPAGASPRMLTNPAQSNEGIRRTALVSGAVNSVKIAKGLLTPNVLNEMKGIKFTPGKIYQQFATSEGKKFYRNLYNAIGNMLYIKTGAAATPTEIEGQMGMYMVAANDDINDANDRLDMLNNEVSLFKGGATDPATSESMQGGGKSQESSSGYDTDKERRYQEWKAKQLGGGQ